MAIEFDVESHHFQVVRKISQEVIWEGKDVHEAFAVKNAHEDCVVKVQARIPVSFEEAGDFFLAQQRAAENQ